MKDTNNHLISVILPVSNNASFVSSSLDSLLNQNYQNIEIIAIDDNSTDLSWSILRSYKKRDKRLKISRNVKKYGLAVTLNRAVKKAKGKFVAFMDARDEITKNKLQKQLDFLLKNEKVVAVGTQCIFISEENKRMGKSNFPALHEHISEKPLHGVSVLFEGVMINRFRIPKDLLYFPNQKHFFFYSDMALKLMQYGELANLPEYLHFHRKHTYYSSIKSVTKQLFSLAKLWTISKAEYTSETPSIRSLFSSAFKLNPS